MACIQPKSEITARPPQAGNPTQWQGLEKPHQAQDRPVKQRVHYLTEAYLAHAIIEVFCAAQNLNFNPHEINWQVPAIYFREPHRILLSGHNRSGLALF